MGKGDAVIVCCVEDRPDTDDGSTGASTCMRGVPDESVAAGGWYRERMRYRVRRLSGAALAITVLEGGKYKGAGTTCLIKLAKEEATRAEYVGGRIEFERNKETTVGWDG